jgi:NAD(P)-dependent dehydrogenase (short-subunit alcohol dehydrogenase family)
MNKIDLNGRCAVVTGGAQGFGRAITERFVVSTRSTPHAIKRCGRSARSTFSSTTPVSPEPTSRYGKPISTTGAG